MAKLLTGTRIYGTGTIDTQLFVSGNNAASSTITGALQVIGGAGVGGNLYVGGTIYGTIVGTITGTATTATQVNTALQTANASYYPTFVDANNASATGESLYTTSSFSINPATGAVNIVGTSTVTKLQLGQSYGGITPVTTSSIKIIGTANTATDEVFINLVRDRNPSVQFAGAASITLGSYSVPTTGSPPSSRLTFLLKSTSDNTDVANVSVMSLLDTGNVGIGTTSPASKLDIKQSGTNWYDGIRILRSTTDTQRLVFGNTSGASWIASVDAAGGSNNQLVFGRSIDGTTFAESARFDSTGNLGIGTTAPIARLNIATSETKAQNATVAVFATSTLGVNDFQLLLSRGTNAYYALQAVEQGVAYRNLVLQFDGGSVGIGTTAPNTKLDVAGAKNVAAINITQTAPAVANAFDDYVAIDFRMYNEVFPAPQFTGNPSARISSYLESGSNIFGLDFWTRSGAGTFGKVMRLTGAGGLSFGASGTAYGTAGQILQSNGNTSPTWINASSIVATTAANIVGGLSGQLLYQSAPSTTAFVSTSTVGNVLVTNGTSAPAFQNTLTLSGTTVSSNTITGAFQVVGGVGIGGNLNVGGNEIITGNAAINGGSLTTNVTTFNLVNTTATTVNFAGAGTTISIGASTGNTTVKNNLVVVGNMTVQGTTTIVDSTVTNISDPIITLGGNANNAAPTVDDNKDRGVAFKWYDGGVAKVGFFGFQDSTRFFTFYNSATITNEVVAPAGGTTKGALDAYLAGGSAQSIVYQSSPNVTAFLAASTAGYILQTNSTGSAPTWVAPSGLTAGNATNATYLLSSDDRTKSPSDDNSGSLRFGFTSFGNNNSSPYADYLHLRSYTDSSGGNDNLVMFRKDVIGMRIWQQAWGTSTAYTSYKDVAFTDSNITGAAAQVNTVLQTANASYYPTFVDANNAAAAAESLYTTSSFSINARSGAITLAGDTLISNVSSSQASGLGIQRVYSTAAGGGAIYLLGTWYDTEGAVALEIQVSSETSANSGSTTYRWQGGFASIASVGTYYRLFPFNEGRGHGDGADSGLNLNAWATYVYKTDDYTYGIAVSVPAGRTVKTLVTTISELKRGMTYTAGANTAVATWTTGTNVYSNRNLIVENLVTATSGYFNGTVTATNFVGAFSGAITGAASQVNTVLQTASASYYPTFVDTNNASATAESLYTTSGFYINPSNGAIQLNGTGGFNLGQPTPIAFANGQYIKDNGGGGLVSYSGAAMNLNAVSGVTLSPTSTSYAQQSGALLSVNGGSYLNGTLNQGAGYAYLGSHNTNGAYPAFAGTNIAMAWNFTAGNAEMNIWNTVNPTTYTGTGFRFMQQTTATSYRDLMFLRQDGALAFGGQSNVGTAGQVLQSNGSAAPTWVAVSGLAPGQLSTIRQTANASYYPTFVDTNNATATAEAFYTTSSFSINPQSGLVSCGISIGDTTNAIALQSDYSLPLIVQRAAAQGKGAIVMRGSDTIGTAIEHGRSQVATDWGTYLAFLVHNDNTSDVVLSLKEKMRINGTGVGIGTAAPTYTLDVRRADDTSGGAIRFGTKTYAMGLLGEDTTTNMVIFQNVYSTANVGFKWLGGSTPNAGTEFMRIHTNGNVGIGTTAPAYKLEVNGAFAATTKSFVINHPTKPGMKLRYGSLEGPENGIYVRGKLTGKHTIELPEYWTKLVDPNSITVSLTSIGKHQDLYVADIANNVVTVGNGNILSKAINCFYVVYGERADVDKLVVEI